MYLNRIIESIKSCRSKRPIDDLDTSVVTSNVKESNFDFVCSVCGNKV